MSYFLYSLFRPRLASADNTILVCLVGGANSFRGSDKSLVEPLWSAAHFTVPHN